MNPFKASAQNVTKLKPIQIISSQQDEIQVINTSVNQPIYKRQDKFIDSLTILLIVCFSLFVILAFCAFQLLNDGSKKKQSFSRDKVTLIILEVGQDQSLSLESIKSHLDVSGAEIYQAYIGVSNNSRLQNLQIENVRFFIAEQYPFSLNFIDQVISEVETDFYYLTTTEWVLKSRQFIRFSKQIMSQFPQISQVMFNQFEKLQRTNGLLSKLGFSFSPGLHKTSTFKNFGNFSTLAAGFFRINERSEYKISKIYESAGYQALIFHRFQLKRIHKEIYFKIVQQPMIVTEQMVNEATGEINFPNFTWQEDLQKPVPPPAPPIMKNIGQYLNYAQSLLRSPTKVFQIELLHKNYPELPFCLLVFPSQKYSKDKILEPINLQNYANIKVIMQQNIKQASYFYFLKLINQNCPNNAVIMFVNYILKADSINHLNILHQQNVAWITYTSSQIQIEVISFYSRIYELLSKNDFNKTNQQFLKANNIKVQALGFLELCSNFSIPVQKQNIIQQGENSYFYVTREDPSPCNRTVYQRIHRLSQDMHTQTWIFDWSKMIAVKQKRFEQKVRAYFAYLINANMRRAIDRQQSSYLPDNHSIKLLQKLDYNKKFRISNYSSIKAQTPFCLTILNHDNIQNDRYKKAIDSIIQQDYQNYRIIFIDDSSSDNGMQLIMQYFKKLKFPEDRVKFIQNRERMYATYNILNAAFNFCREDQVQMLMDGDDELIGKYAFQVMNSAYQQNPNLWVVYSNYKNNYYEYGLSLQMKYQSTHMYYGKRKLISNIGPIRTWRVQLLYNIPIEHHLNQNGTWLDTLYDDALQHPLSQLSTVKRMRYINQILYQYNTNYGSNDNSNAEKRYHRQQTYRHIITLTPLKPLESLNGSVRNEDVYRQLQNNSTFQVLEYKLLNV